MTQRQTARAFRHPSAELCLDRQKAPPGMTPDPRDRGFRSIQVEHAGSAECILRRSMRGYSAGLRPAPAGSAGRWPATSDATAKATAKAGDPWNGGVGPVARDAVDPSLGAWQRHPCRGHPRNRTHPAFDRFPRSVDGSTPCVDESLSDNEIDWGQIRFPLENGSDPRTPCRSRISPTVTGKLSKVGRCGLAGPLAPWMAPSSPHGRVYGVSCQSTPHRQTTDNPEPLWLWLWAVAGQRPAHRRCRAQPCRPTLPCARKRFH